MTRTPALLRPYMSLTRHCHDVRRTTDQALEPPHDGAYAMADLRRIIVVALIFRIADGSSVVSTASADTKRYTGSIKLIPSSGLATIGTSAPAAIGLASDQMTLMTSFPATVPPSSWGFPWTTGTVTARAPYYTSGVNSLVYARTDQRMPAGFRAYSVRHPIRDSSHAGARHAGRGDPLSGRRRPGRASLRPRAVFLLDARVRTRGPVRTARAFESNESHVDGPRRVKGLELGLAHTHALVDATLKERRR
jgi:hypothetical protein